MKQPLLVSILLLTVSIAWSQDKKEKKSAFSIGGEAAFPVGTEAKGYGLGWGGSLQEELIVGKVGITFNAGYLRHTTRRYVSEAIKNQGWLMGGARYYFVKKVYAGGQPGATVLLGNDHGGALFAYTASVGTKLNVIDLSLRYMSSPVNFKFSTVGLRAAIIL